MGQSGGHRPPAPRGTAVGQDGEYYMAVYYPFAGFVGFTWSRDGVTWSRGAEAERRAVEKSGSSE